MREGLIRKLGRQFFGEPLEICSISLYTILARLSLQSEYSKCAEYRLRFLTDAIWDMWYLDTVTFRHRGELSCCVCVGGSINTGILGDLGFDGELWLEFMFEDCLAGGELITLLEFSFLSINSPFGPISRQSNKSLFWTGTYEAAGTSIENRLLTDFILSMSDMISRISSLARWLMYALCADLDWTKPDV